MRNRYILSSILLIIGTIQLIAVPLCYVIIFDYIEIESILGIITAIGLLVVPILELKFGTSLANNICPHKKDILSKLESLISDVDKKIKCLNSNIQAACYTREYIPSGLSYMERELDVLKKEASAIRETIRIIDKYFI